MLAEMSLIEQGWNALNLGPHTPFDALTDGVKQHRPRLVWISVSHLPDPEAFLAGYGDFHDFARRHNVAVAVGGRALSPAELARMRYSMHGDGLTRLTDFAATLFNRPPTPKRGRPRLAD
jgi:hypothetical protein